MGHKHIRRWDSGALAHAVTDPFGQGPLPWLRGSETYFDDTGQVVPWYVDPAPAAGPDPGRRRGPGRRTRGRPCHVSYTNLQANNTGGKHTLRLLLEKKK
ncbi:hypothetical protein P1P75_41625, partial [Streptomyces sp. ID05-39B]|nr:hypothetical protein [Streptomyces sp. ID05-39B]